MAIVARLVTAPAPELFQQKPAAARVLALDQANACGWAHSCGPSGVWDLNVRKDESKGMRLIRLRAKLNEMRAAVGVDIVVFEVPRASPKTMGALVSQSELLGVIKLWCEDNHVEYRGFQPAEVKRQATGKGNSNKDAMCEAAKRKWPAKFPGLVKDIDHNQADALWILDLAMSQL